MACNSSKMHKPPIQRRLHRLSATSCRRNSGTSPERSDNLLNSRYLCRSLRRHENRELAELSCSCFQLFRRREQSCSSGTMGIRATFRRDLYKLFPKIWAILCKIAGTVEAVLKWGRLLWFTFRRGYGNSQDRLCTYPVRLSRYPWDIPFRYTIPWDRDNKTAWGFLLW